MKKKELKEIHSKTSKELRGLEKKIRDELAHLKIDLKAGKLKNIQSYYDKKRDFARIKTIIKKLELNENT